jgi:hypothetical protein
MEPTPERVAPAEPVPEPEPEPRPTVEPVEAMEPTPEPVEPPPSVEPVDRVEPREQMPLPTVTLARLALDQGDRALASRTLESVLERDPDNAEAANLLESLWAPAADTDVAVKENASAFSPAPTSAGARIAALQGWLDAVRLAAERRAP